MECPPPETPRQVRTIRLIGGLRRPQSDALERASGRDLVPDKCDDETQPDDGRATALSDDDWPPPRERPSPGSPAAGPPRARAEPALIQLQRMPTAVHARDAGDNPVCCSGSL